MEKIIVYYFTCFDISTRQEYKSPKMATRERIAELQKDCAPLKETAKEINISDLDPEGFYWEKK